MQSFVLVYLLAISCVVLSKPLDESIVDAEMDISPAHRLWKRFVNPSNTFGNFDDSAIDKLRTKRRYALCSPNPRFRSGYSSHMQYEPESIHKQAIECAYHSGPWRQPAEECEKLELCKLHARANRNFISAFELYFVNKENAQLWDHKRHTMADCERRFNCYDDYE